MTKRTQLALDTLNAGGYFRKALETGYRGCEQFKMRLRDHNGRIVKGVSFKTFYELQDMGLLTSRPCLSSSTWPSEFELIANWENRTMTYKKYDFLIYATRACGNMRAIVRTAHRDGTWTVEPYCFVDANYENVGAFQGGPKTHITPADVRRAKKNPRNAAIQLAK